VSLGEGVRRGQAGGGGRGEGGARRGGKALRCQKNPSNGSRQTRSQQNRHYRNRINENE